MTILAHVLAYIQTGEEDCFVLVYPVVGFEPNGTPFLRPSIDRLPVKLAYEKGAFAVDLAVRMGDSIYVWDDGYTGGHFETADEWMNEVALQGEERSEAMIGFQSKKAQAALKKAYNAKPEKKFVVWQTPPFEGLPPILNRELGQAFVPPSTGDAELDAFRAQGGAPVGVFNGDPASLAPGDVVETPEMIAEARRNLRALHGAGIVPGPTPTLDAEDVI